MTQTPTSSCPSDQRVLALEGEEIQSREVNGRVHRIIGSVDCRLSRFSSKLCCSTVKEKRQRATICESLDQRYI